MPQHRAISFHVKNKKKDEDNIILASSSTWNKHAYYESSADKRYMESSSQSRIPLDKLMSPLSRRTSISTSLIHELKNNDLFKEQQAKVGDGKSKSTEYLERYSSLHPKYMEKKLAKEHPRKSVSFPHLLDKHRRPEMNFFGNVGPLNSVKTNPKSSLATQKKWHSTKNLHEEASSKSSLASQTRRKNRKNNLDTRSLWYDYKDTAEGEGYTLRKSSSLDNLLGKSSTNNKSKIQLTKDMISSPQYPRKIVGEWGRRTTSKMFDNSFSIAGIEEETTEKDESEITEFELDPGSEAMQLDEASDISMVETVVSVDTAIIEESIGPDEPPDSFQAIKEDTSHAQLHYSASSTSEDDNNPTPDIDLPDGTYGTVDETAFEADTDSKPVIFNNDSDDTSSEVSCSSLENQSVHLSGSENASVKCEMSEEKLVENEEAIVESAPPSPGMTMTVEEFLRMPVPNNERFKKHDKVDGRLKMLKVSSSENCWGTRTVDRFKRKNINKIDISGPSDLRRWSGTQGSSSNLLGMKNLSKSTDDVSVSRWLKTLRYAFEYYEPYDDRTLGLNDMETPFDAEENCVKSDAKSCDCEEDCVKSCGSRGRDVKSWNCVKSWDREENCVKSYGGGERDAKLLARSCSLDVKFAVEREVSVEYEGGVVALRLPERRFTQIEYEVPEDVMLWKERIREDYSEEEQDIMERSENDL
ncbi:unnamed protein product [Phaedon cochleariae]|uniref:Uncharacterized protein n=1 Tax=Phaedon cochleariae TaxID=80249 RepID=A0A9N9SF21_PHACE|nr:unnamed protein product [Phaedon cochleariae]